VNTGDVSDTRREQQRVNWSSQNVTTTKLVTMKINQ